MEIVQYSNYECCALENDSIRMLVTHSVGPRIIYFGFKDDENLFAELPDFKTELPGGSVFHFYGGHRLWQAPEDFETTYIPDDDPVEIKLIENGMVVTQKNQPETGLQKSLEIRLTGKASVAITHRIANHGKKPIICAPWAITQFKTGGVAILPQAGHDMGMLPNRSLAIWSYTNLTDPNVKLGNRYILINAEMKSPFKVGYPNPRGWLAYWLSGILFVKRAKYEAQAEYYDLGSSSECYCNGQFLELETLAPINEIKPEASVIHVEQWDLYNGIERPQNEDDAQALTVKLDLE